MHYNILNHIVFIHSLIGSWINLCFCLFDIKCIYEILLHNRMKVNRDAAAGDTRMVVSLYWKVNLTKLILFWIKAETNLFPTLQLGTRQACPGLFEFIRLTPVIPPNGILLLKDFDPRVNDSTPVVEIF